jgi:hypothetical protein
MAREIIHFGKDRTNRRAAASGLFGVSLVIRFVLCRIVVVIKGLVRTGAAVILGKPIDHSDRFNVLFLIRFVEEVLQTHPALERLLMRM